MDSLISFVAADFLGNPAWVWLTFIGCISVALIFSFFAILLSDRRLHCRNAQPR
jgi:tellurite resistance protein TerC